MKPEIIDEINSIMKKKFGRNQDIFIQPNNVPYIVKEPVIYSRSDVDNMESHLMILDEMILMFCPNISYKQYREIQKTIKTDRDYDLDYYEGRDDYIISYIILSDFEALVWEFLNGK